MSVVHRAVKVDFFSFTTRRAIPDVCSLFSDLPNPLEMKERGLYGYQFSFVSPDGVTILFSPGRSDVHVQMSGRGCERGFLPLLDLIAEKDTVTRLDIAIDCIGSGFTCSDMWRYLQRGSFVSVSSDIRQLQGLLSRGGTAERLHRSQEQWSGSGTCEAPNRRLSRTRSNTGHTIYLGSSSSDRMVRIYDKGAESGTGADWLRFEVQLRRESANHFYSLIAKKYEFHRSGCAVSFFECCALGLLNKQIRLFELGQPMQKDTSRLKLLPFWEMLISKIAPLKLKLPKPLKTIRSTLRYVRNVGASLKLLRGVMPDYEEFIHGVVDDAELKPHHRALQDDMAEGYSQPDEYYHYLYSQCAV